MKIVDILFFIGSVCAMIAGFSEITAVRSRYYRKEKQNWKTPLFMFIVKLTRLPKFISLAMLDRSVFSFSSWLPAISAIGASIVWGIAFFFAFKSRSYHDAIVDTTNNKDMSKI